MQERGVVEGLILLLLPKSNPELTRPLPPDPLLQNPPFVSVVAGR